MATLILTAVGTAVGGPIGGAIGAAVGQYIDQTILFAPKARQGPRLGDLSIQTSSYGSPIPKLFGTMRVAGTVIWSTDLIESRGTSGGGKGRPKTVNYSYAASFAVALSGRPILGVGRIWADGKLLRGAAGDFKSATEFRVYKGDEDQPPDPLIASADGADLATAFRGVAYAMFEDFQLEDYGNRIPSLTFEVEADAGPVAIGAIATALAGGAAVAGSTPAVAGYAAGGDSISGAIGALSDVVPMSLADDGQALVMTADFGTPTLLSMAGESGRREVSRRGAGSLPAEATIVYYDTGRDFQTGLQRAIRGGGRGADRRALPAALDAPGAKALADYRLSALWAGRTRAKLTLAWRGAAVRPGQCVALAGEAGKWKVERWTLGPMTVALELTRLPNSGPPDPGAASPGAGVYEPDLSHGPTILRVYDLPLGDGRETKPLLFVAAAGAEAGWRRAALTSSYDGGESWQDLGSTAPAATLGSTLEALPPGSSALFDTRAAIEVELVSDAMWLEGRGDDALVRGANLAAIGDELVQFGAVEVLGGRRFRLSRLLRGRRGTEWAAAGHEAGVSFTLIDADALVTIEAPVGSLGGESRIMASGIADLPDPPVAIAEVLGDSLRPPSPVHLAAREDITGDLALSWVRRSRQGWSWQSGADTPLGEETESYRLTIAGPGFVREATLAAPVYLYTAAARAEDGTGGPILISVAQIGTYAPSRPALLSLG